MPQEVPTGWPWRRHIHLLCRHRRRLIRHLYRRSRTRLAEAFFAFIQQRAELGRFRDQPIDRRAADFQPARLDNGQRRAGGRFVMHWSSRTGRRRNRRRDRVLAEQRRHGPAEMIAAGVEADRPAPVHEMLGQLAQRLLGPSRRRIGRATPLVGCDARRRGWEGEIVQPLRAKRRQPERTASAVLIVWCSHGPSQAHASPRCPRQREMRFCGWKAKSAAGG